MFEVSARMLCLWGLSAAVAGQGPGATFSSAWPRGVTRVWAGPAFYGNRLYDWRIHDGRLECLEGSRARPMRTLHLLTHVAAERPGVLSMRVRSGPLDRSTARPARTWRGFLIGVGGAHVDHRISALCHHWPAADGGLIAALDGSGRLVFRDNTNPEAPKGPRRNLPPSAWPELEASAREGAARLAAEAAVDVELRLRARPVEGRYELTLEAVDPHSRLLLSRAVLGGVAPEQVSGNVALVSHESPEGKGRGYWFADWRVSGDKLEHHPERAFGPIVSTQYTVHRGVLKMTAQMTPVADDDPRAVRLELRTPDGWRSVADAAIQPHSYTAHLRVEGYDASKSRDYRVVYALGPHEGGRVFTWSGRIRRDPRDRERLVVAAFTGHHISAAGKGDWNGSSFWYPHEELVRAVAHHDPDLLFFSGDQIYEGGLAGIVRRPPEKACLDYLYHWYRWCLAFRELTRERPTITIPDDHDVYHGNIWGAGGVPARGPLRPLSDNGGYIMDPLFVNAVHRTQVGNLPDPYDPTPIAQGITVYYTELVWGGVSFAILADRMWKSSPAVLVPEGRVRNGWFQNPEFDPCRADVAGAVLLGPRQLDFLEHWAGDWSGGARMKAVLSQTIFTNVATLPASARSDAVVPKLTYPKPGEYVEGDRIAADADSNGWPQSGRNRALKAMRKAFAFHVAGDQHLASFVGYGIDDWRDAGHAFCVPSIANLWPRRWFPPVPGLHRAPGAPRYTGDFEDGFCNKMTVYAVANPRDQQREPKALYDRAPGYGIVRFDTRARTITAECWPRWADPGRPDARQYEGWPITVTQREQYGRAPRGFVQIEVRGVAEPVVQLVDETGSEVVYTIRLPTPRGRLPVFAPGPHTLRISDPEAGRNVERRHVVPGGELLVVELPR